MENPFVGRTFETSKLNQMWQSTKSQFLVLYGRRRVGKTRLVLHWAEQAKPEMILWLVDPDSKDAHLKQFSQKIWKFAFPHMVVPEEFTYASWDQAWTQVAELATTARRICIFIDEFTYLMEADSTIPGKFQRIWDQILENCNLFLIISGSHIGMMHRGLLAYQAPLYGRSTHQMRLYPLPFGVTGEYFPNYSDVDRVAIYAIFGGIPYYWRWIEQSRSLTWNIHNTLLSPGGPAEGEARLLLQDYINDLHNYVSILRAIANGKNTPKDIEGFTGISNNFVTPYLKVLIETGYVIRYESITAKHPTRSGRYYIVDPMLRFYYRFLASRKEQFALGESNEALEELKRHMVDFIGTYTWEELCREWVLRASARKEIPLFPDQVGSVWDKSGNVDVVGINMMENTLVLGTCKWTSEPEKSDTLEELVKKYTLIAVPDNPQKKWQVYFLGFSRSGWNSNAEKYARSVISEKISGANWSTAGFKLISLKDLDRDMARWVLTAGPDEG